MTLPQKLGRIGALLVVLSSCGGNAAPVVVPPAGRIASTVIVDAGAPTRESACSLFQSNRPACLNETPNPARRDSAAAARARGLMALGSAGIPRFATDHPTWDGRGVLVAIMDSGIDPGIPGLGTTTDGTPKILDLRDFSNEGRVPLQRAVRHGDTLFVGSRHLIGASGVAALAGDSQIWGGTLSELPLGKAPSADISGNGVVGDTLLIVVAHTASGWALFADTDGDGSLRESRAIHDYLVAHEIFGWQQQAGASGGLVPVPVYVAANFADSAGTPVLDLFFDTSSHGTHVSGIAAGHDIYGVPGFDGVAPGAKLLGIKIANNAHGGVTTTGSMLRGLDYAIRFAAERSMPLVVNLSFGVGEEIEGTARINAIIDSMLAVHPDVVMTVASSNDGPGLSSLGFPGTASRVISVGATLPVVFSGANLKDTTSEPVAAFSSRGGEIAGPDLVVPGAAYSTVPNYARGEELENGTSMASPYAAGLAARLMSAAKLNGQSFSARFVRRALRMGARLLPSGTAVDQGAGLPDIGRAWNWLNGSHDVPDVAVDVGAVKGRGAVLLTASPAGSTARALGARVVLRRQDGTAALSVRLATDATWLQLPETVLMAAGRGEFTLSVTLPPNIAPGTLTSTVRVEGPDEAAGPLAVIPVTVRIPISAAGTRTPIALHQDPGSVGRVFVPADSGRGLQIEIATLREQDKVGVGLHEPGGMPFRNDRTIGAGFGGGAGMFDIDANDVATGIYEVDVEASPFATADTRITVRQSPLRIGATLTRDTLHVTAKSLVGNALSVRLRAGLIGASRRINLTGQGSADVRVAIAVPKWAARTVVDTRMPREAWSRFTDLGFSFYDRRGKLLDVTPVNYAFSRGTPTLPDSIAGDSMIVVLSPGFADPADHAPWSIDLDVRFYVDTPFSLDAGGAPAKPLAAGALREDRFTPGPMPITFPPEFLPLVTIVALEGSDHIWTREVTVSRPAGTKP